MNAVKVFFAVVLALGFHRAWARLGGDLVNNGGGLAEKNVLYAYEKLDRYMQYCLNSASCKLNERQKAIALQIYQGLSQEKANPGQLVFSSEKKNPGAFLIDGNIRVAKTGSTIGSAIVVNTDLLYSKSADSYEAVSIPEAVAILVHEFGHHHGNYSHEELDLIGVRISMMMQQKIINTPLLPWESFASASVFNSNLRADFPQVLLTVGDDVIDISEIYKQSVRCQVLTLPIPILPIPDLELITRDPAGSILHNLHWEKIKEKDDSVKVKITGNVSNTCLYKHNVEIRNNNSQMSISFTVNKVGANWKYDPTTLVLDQFKDPWWKFIKLP